MTRGMIASMLAINLLLDEPGCVLLGVVEAMGFVTDPFITIICAASMGSE